MTNPLAFLRRRNREKRDAKTIDQRAPSRCRRCQGRLVHLGAILGGTALYGCRECHLVYWESPPR